MNPLIFPTLVIVGSAAAVGTVLGIAISVLRRPDPAKFREMWLKLGILLAIVLILLCAGAFGHWGLLPVILFLAYMGWKELLQSVEHKYGAIATPILLPLLGTLGTLGGWFATPFAILVGVIAATWGAIALPILIARRPPPLHGTLTAAFGMVVITLPLAHLLALGSRSYGLFALLILLVLSNDGFSEGFGRFIGRTPLCPDISPNKTWEGAIGGLVSCIALSYALNFLVPRWQLWQVVGVATGISVLALIGDLSLSALKREAGIKDFSQILAVTGGILDKFDGLLFTVPVFYAIADWIGG